MSTSTNQREIQELLDDLRLLGYTVVKSSSQYRVTSPGGGTPVHIPVNMSSGKELSGIRGLLLGIGFTAERVAAARQADRKRRLEEDRKANERALALAQQKAEEASAPTLASPFAVPGKKVAPKKLPTGTRQPGIRPVDDTVTTDTLDVGEMLAVELLRMNRFATPDTLGQERNRTINRTRVIEYATAMLRGAWLATNQGVGVDVNGVLVDGQKRLAAVVLATSGSVDIGGGKKITLPSELKADPDLTIPLSITWNLPSESKYVVDQGEFRTVAHKLGMAGKAQAHALGAIVKLVIMYDEGVSWTQWDRTRVSVEDLLAKIELEPDLEESPKLATAVGTLMTGSAVGAGAYLARREYPGGPLGDFLHGLKTGENLAKGDPRLALREELLKRAAASRTTRRQGDSAVYLALFLKAWNDFATGQRRVQLRFAENETYPVAYAPPSPGKK